MPQSPPQSAEDGEGIYAPERKQAVEGFVHFHAGRVIVVKGAAAHTAGIDGKPISLCRLPGGNGLFDLCEVDHGDSFLAFLGDDSFRHKKSPHLRKSGNGGAIGTIRPRAE